jgi:ketosteroid isomerase-like protein
MRTILLTVIPAIVSMSLSGQVKTTIPESPSGVPAIFIEGTTAWKEAYNSKDTAKLAALYSPDAIYCSAHVPALVASGRNQVRDYFRGGMMMGGHIDSIAVLTCNLSGDLAALFCKYIATNAGVTVNGRNLIVLRKVDGKWLFVTHMTVVKD